MKASIGTSTYSRADMSLKEGFLAAVEHVRLLTSRPTNDELLLLYGLFKQATKGDNNTPKPGMLNLKARKKWEAWCDRKGMTCEQAMVEYIRVVHALLAKYPSAAAAFSADMAPEGSTMTAMA